MILKILSRSSPGGIGGLISYILAPGKGIDGNEPEPLVHNFRGSTPKEWVKELYTNMAFRNHKKGHCYFYHAILSYSNLDRELITPELLADMTRKFIELRGKEGMYIAGSHSGDRDCAHTHILISGNALKASSAFSLRISELQKLKNDLQQFQELTYPELVHSLPNHGRGREYLSSEEYAVKTRKSQKYIKAELSQILQATLAQSASQQDFLSLLRDKHGIHHYERGKSSQPYGVVVEGKNYRFSTLGIDIGQIYSLQNDPTEEQKALEEIQRLRDLTEHSQKELLPEIIENDFELNP